MKYSYRENNGYKGLDPDVLGSELEKIRKKHGTLTPDVTVQEAASPKSPLHPHYEWDDKKAAQEHRLDQARKMIRSIYIVIEDRPDYQIPAHINIQGDQGATRGYFPVEEVMADPAMRAEALRRIWENLSRLRRFYSHIEEFSRVWEAIEETGKKIAKKK